MNEKFEYNGHQDRVLINFIVGLSLLLIASFIPINSDTAIGTLIGIINPYVTYLIVLAVVCFFGLVFTNKFYKNIYFTNDKLSIFDEDVRTGIPFREIQKISESKYFIFKTLKVKTSKGNINLLKHSFKSDAEFEKIKEIFQTILLNNSKFQ